MWSFSISTQILYHLCGEAASPGLNLNQKRGVLNSASSVLFTYFALFDLSALSIVKVTLSYFYSDITAERTPLAETWQKEKWWFEEWRDKR